MRYSTMNPYVDAAAHARKRPRSDDVEHTPLPPLHAFNNHHHQQQMASVFQPSYHAPMRPAILPTLSQVLNPTMQFSVLAPPPARMPFLQQESVTPPQRYIRPDVTPNHFEQHQPHAPSPPPSEASMDDDDDAEDKTPWPTASEYYALLTDESKKANIPVYDLGVDPRGVPQQPECIYNEPRSCMYFLKCSQLLGRGSFGFPRKKKTTVTTKNSKGDVESVRRCDVSKEYEWRKMSFVTGLPKKKPIVRYITATCYSKTHRSASEKKKVMRMHAVMLANEDGTGECGDYVLVHIRAGGSKRVGVRTNSSTPSSETVTPMASPASDESSSPSVPSVRSLLSAHNHLSMNGDRPLTPLIYNNYQGREYSASPVVKRPRGDLMPLAASNACPRQMPLWLSPPSVDHQH